MASRMTARCPKRVDDAIERERCDLGLWIFDQHQAGLRHADFGDRRRHRARQRGTVGDRGLSLRPAGGYGVHEIGVDQQGRMLEHPAGDFRLIGGKPHDHRGRRKLAEGERPRQRLAHHRRRIVEQHDERALGGGAIVGRQVRVEIGARHGGRGIRPVRGGCRPCPLQELTNDHAATDAMLGHRCSRHRRLAPAGSKANLRGLIKRSP